jgi:AmmeMemoRadiSam system protein A
VSGDTVCGVRPVGVLVSLLAHAFDGAGEVLEVTTSGHVSGRFDLSVTYAAIAFTGEWSAWSAESDSSEDALDAASGAALVSLARAALRSRLEHTTELAEWFANHETDGFVRPGGAFVTLNSTGSREKNQGRLRACMGRVEADQPLVDAVIQAAVWATRDPRFPPLESAELDEVEVEVSVLSPMRVVRSYRDIEVGTHGVLMTKRGHRAVFLPQVATDQGWNRTAMLEHLSTKAGLPADAWRDGAEFEVFTAQVFRENR